MKNWLLSISMLMMAISFICCHQQEEWASNPTISLEDQSPAAKDLSDLAYGDIPEIEISDVNCEDCCVYKIKWVNSDCTSLAANDIICVACDEDGKCPGVSRLIASSFKFTNGKEVCTGSWYKQEPTVTHTDCMECPTGGKNGYKFVE